MTREEGVMGSRERKEVLGRRSVGGGHGGGGGLEVGNDVRHTTHFK